MLKRFIILFCLGMFLISGVYAQTSPAKAILDLKEGVLIVRLRSDLKKISAMKRVGYNEKADRIEIKTALENQIWMKTFSEKYNFSDVLFSYDTLRKVSLDNGGQNCFLGQDLKIDSNLTLEGRPFLIMTQRAVNSSTLISNAGIFVFSDADFKKLQRPFPFYEKKGMRTANLTYWVDKLSNPDTAEQNKISKLVGILNRKLTSFYENKR